MGPQGGSIGPEDNKAQTGSDGRFSVNNVQPGEYLLAVRSAARSDQPAQEARQMIQVAGGDIDGLVIVTGSGGTLRGQVRLTRDTGTGSRSVVVRARPLTWAARNSTLGSSGTGRVNADGTFELKALVGPVVLSVGALTGEWTLKAVQLNGRDLADDPIDVPHAQTIDGVRVVLTNRPTQLRGALIDEQQHPADSIVVIFPEDTSRWREDSRTIRSAGRINTASSRSRDCRPENTSSPQSIPCKTGSGTIRNFSRTCARVRSDCHSPMQRASASISRSRNSLRFRRAR